MVGLAVGGYFLSPVKTMLNTVSTDDAYVNGHVTFVAPRVAGQVSRVLVDDNYRVKKGDLLVQLDKEPYQVQVAIKQAAVAAAEADLTAAQAQVRGLVAHGRSQSLPARARHRGRQHPDRQPASQRGDLESKKATLALAQANLKRGEELVAERGHQQGRPRPAPADGQGRRGGRRASPAGGLRDAGSASGFPPSRPRATT